MKRRDVELRIKTLGGELAVMVHTLASIFSPSSRIMARAAACGSRIKMRLRPDAGVSMSASRMAVVRSACTLSGQPAGIVMMSCISLCSFSLKGGELDEVLPEQLKVDGYKIFRRLSEICTLSVGGLKKRRGADRLWEVILVHEE